MSAPGPTDVRNPPHSTRALIARWVSLLLAGLIGTVGYAWLASDGLRVGLSFLGGVALVVACFEFGGYNIRFTSRYFPQLALAVAVMTYGFTVVALGLVLALSSPRVVDGPAVAVGLFVGLTIWLGTEILHSRVR